MILNTESVIFVGETEETIHLLRAAFANRINILVSHNAQELKKMLSNQNLKQNNEPVPLSPFCESEEEECDECIQGIVRVDLDFEDRELVSKLEDHAMIHDSYEAILFWAIGRIRFLESASKGVEP